jgi:maltooligosyltrehalose trehalohydrolase
MSDQPRTVSRASLDRPRWNPEFGAVRVGDGVQFRVWASAARRLTLFVRHGGVVQRWQPARVGNGIWDLFLPAAKVLPGSRYAYAIDDRDPLPDPASRFQPDGVHGWSEVIDPTFAWTDGSWRGIDAHRLVLCELHVGTFSRTGTFAGVTERLEYLRDLGITAIELMPLADFPGRRNWGYDGASLFAPSRAYGRPEDLRALVDRAHSLGLAVIIDVVYNHLGPEGAYLPAFSPDFLTSAHQTPWGSAVNLDREGSAITRRFLIENARHWIHEYHADGLRLDATHALYDESPTPFVRELTRAVHAARDPRPIVIAEDHRNLASMVKAIEDEGWGLDGLWADDFHHVIRRMLAGDAHGYYVDYKGTAEELAAILSRGWLFVGQTSKHRREPRGTDPSGVPMRASIVCVQNHDQIGNRAFGDRLHHTADPAAWRAGIAVLLTSPMTPLLFMGQEWAASTPFQFFTDFEPGLGQKVIEGRRAEFRVFPEFAAPDAAARLPDPQADTTFESSRLRWDETGAAEHAGSFALHRTLLRLRADHPALQASDATTARAVALDDATVMVTRPGRNGTTAFVICARLRGQGTVLLDIGRATTVLTTEDPSFAGDARPPIVDLDHGMITFHRPGAVIFECVTGGAA